MQETDKEKQDRRLTLARKAYREFFAQCFWSADPALEIEAQQIPFVIHGLRYYGGHAGYRVAAELCR